MRPKSRVTTSIKDLMSWAKYTVSAANDRSQTLIERVYKTTNDNEYCKKLEVGCETWSQITVNTKTYDNGVF